MTPDSPSEGSPADGASPERSIPHLLPTHIADYRLVRLLGTGGMGDVYEAEQDRPRRRVALKVIRPERTSAADRRRFAHEAEVLARLRHPGIAQVYSVGTAGTATSPLPYIAMELVHGVPLNEFVRTRAPAVRRRVELLADIADAVAHAHAHGVIHRDLKPANVLVEDGGRAKVLDFGVARTLGAEVPGDASRTRAGDLVGTLAYMSPEQAAGDAAALDTRADVYSLGVLAFETLSGRLPHPVEGCSLPKLLHDRSERPAPSLKSVVESTPTDLSVIVAKALEREPARRYAGAAALADDLTRWLKGEPILARPPNAGYLARTFVRRHRALVGGAFATLLALVAGLVISLQYAVDSERERRRADAESADARTETYRAQMAAAVQSLRRHSVDAAREALDRAPVNRRDWEWRWVDAALDSTVDSVGSRVTLHAPFAVTPDGRRCAGVDGAGGYAVVDAETGAVLARGSDAPSVQQLALAPRGLRTVLGLEANGFRACDGPVGREVGFSALAKGFEPGPSVFSPDGTIWYRETHRNELGRSISVVERIDAATLEVLARTEDPAYGASVMAVDGAGRRLAIAGPGTTVRLVATDDLRLERRIVVPMSGCLDAAFSPDGRWLATASSDRTARVHDTASGAQVATFLGHIEAVGSVAWSPDSSRLVTASSDGTVRVWNRAGGEPETVWLARPGLRPLRAVFDPDGRHVHAFDGRHRLTYWAGPSDGFSVLRGHRGTAEGNPYSYVYGVAFSPDGTRLASVGWDHTLRIWSTRTLAALAVIETKGPLHAVDWSHDGRHIAVAGRPSRAAIYDADTGGLVVERDGMTDSMSGAIAFAPDDRRLVAADRDGATVVLDATTLRTLVRWDATADVDRPGTAAWSPDGRRLASQRQGFPSTLRDPSTGTVLGTLPFEPRPVRPGRMAFDATGTRLTATPLDRTARVVDLASSARERVLSGHASEVYAALFSRDGRRVVTGSNDHTIRFWDPVTEATVLSLEGHSSYVYGLAFSPDGETLASASGDNTVRLWTTRRFRDRFKARERALALEAHLESRIRDELGAGESPADMARRRRDDATLDPEQKTAALDVILRLASATAR